MEEILGEQGLSRGLDVGPPATEVEEQVVEGEPRPQERLGKGSLPPESACRSRSPSTSASISGSRLARRTSISAAAARARHQDSRVCGLLRSATSTTSVRVRVEARARRSSGISGGFGLAGGGAAPGGGVHGRAEEGATVAAGSETGASVAHPPAHRASRIEPGSERRAPHAPAPAAARMPAVEKRTTCSIKSDSETPARSKPGSSA